ncbi:MAG: hypothetical protein K2X03_07300 [Bryobacteraceae bacterium]|nr:hypothetical protein [Bryobacteraceae bacterium]
MIFAVVTMGLALPASAGTLDTLLAAFRARLEAEFPQDSPARTARFERALRTYIVERTPADPLQRDIFLGNLAYRLDAMTSRDLEQFDSVIQGPADRPASENSTRFNETLDAVAYYTVTVDSVFVERDRETRRRLPTDRLRTADRNTDWGWAERQFLNFKHSDDQDWGNKKRDVADPLHSTEATYVATLAGRLRRLYSDPGLGLNEDRGLVADLARAQYLMLAEQAVPGGSALRSMDLLQPLARSVATFPRAQTAAEANTQLDQALTLQEKKYGLRGGNPMPVAILSAMEFFELIGAGYLPDDVGADLVHGSLTHRIQWSILFADFERATAGSWRLTPLELLVRIGEFDARREQFNQAQRFAFERAASVWAHIFDQQGERNEEAEFSRPDSMRNILARDLSLQAIRDRVDLIHRDRINAGLNLLEAFEGRGPWPDAWRPPDADALRRSLAAGRDRSIAADELFRARYFELAQGSGRYQAAATAADGTARVLIQQGFRFADAPDPGELLRQRSRSPQLASSDRSRSGAVSSERAVRLRERDSVATTSKSAERREARRNASPEAFRDERRDRDRVASTSSRSLSPDAAPERRETVRPERADLRRPEQRRPESNAAPLRLPAAPANESEAEARPGSERRAESVASASSSSTSSASTRRRPESTSESLRFPDVPIREPSERAVARGADSSTRMRKAEASLK